MTGRALSLWLLFFLIFSWPVPVWGEPGDESVRPPAAFVVFDTPADRGDSLTMEIFPSPDEARADDPVVGYRLWRAVCQADPRRFEDAAFLPALSAAPPGQWWEKPADRLVFLDPDCRDGYDYFYRVAAVTAAGRESAPLDAPAARSRAQWFAADKWNILLLTVIVSAAILFFIEVIKRGRKPFIRKISGLEAVEEASGRATEMGSPILFIPGTNDMNDVQTVSAMIILGRIARTIAEYDTRLLMPTSKSLVMTTARETVKEAYLAAGRPDAYRDEMITYLTDEQFGYVAGVNGIMVREKPATCFFLGAFFAESLLLAEIGNSVGAIQIAGTAMPDQLPFFIATCDYTLIGEELFAAGAYLSQEPRQLGSLKGQDVGKAIAMFFIVLGCGLMTVAEIARSETVMRIAQLVKSLFQVTGG